VQKKLEQTPPPASQVSPSMRGNKKASFVEGGVRRTEGVITLSYSKISENILIVFLLLKKFLRPIYFSLILGQIKTGRENID